jgi:hypothetical protein
MHRETFITKLTEVQQIVEQLLAQLQASEHDKFAAHLYRSRRQYRSACGRAGKGSKNIERSVISTFQVAESNGFQGRRIAQCSGSPGIGGFDHSFGTSILKADAAQFNMAFQGVDGDKPRAISSLLWLRLEDVVEAVEQHSD